MRIETRLGEEEGNWRALRRNRRRVLLFPDHAEILISGGESQQTSANRPEHSEERMGERKILTRRYRTNPTPSIREREGVGRTKNGTSGAQWGVWNRGFRWPDR